ncbi:AAA ATPase [Exophiala xenobiotica]|uniref:Cell division control protein n=1 Tax=Vermiconidia calcicola TaxID=1690605 RepID=A0AAV9QH83_9PEZI|nr:AAA ATPase [Exophiala xenobiotica]KAK5434160.1 AAA ATPase [Exophiala xenobiotica]KAK5542392.1 AAA ATPase [Vermiconidia calcicola]KAK5546250.1 AAA ATPase [Chaetothyriales sp. CCFEE 6169]
MAATVLGKRSRRVLDEEEISITSSTSKRRTRHSAPQIYEDRKEQDELEKQTSPTKSQNVEQLSRSVRPCNERARRTIRDKLITTKTSQVEDQDENIPPAIFSTPATARFRDALATPPSTPKHRVHLGGRLLTPRASRVFTPSKAQNVYSQARQLFTQASNGKVIGREAERGQLSKFISNAIGNKKGGCAYVSGPPGTGKSALVQEVMQEFQEKPVKVATINCVAFKSSNEVLTSFAQEFGCCTGNQKSIKASLARLFTTRRAKPAMHLVLLDEIDTLLSGECEVLYSIFEWAMHPSSSLILIGIANALDLTDRFLPRLKVKNVKPDLLPFLPYSAQQISKIISEKLRSLLPAETTVGADFIPLIHPAAIQLSSKRIASQTGDLRKAFSLVRRVIDKIEQETLTKMRSEQIITSTKQPLAEVQNPQSPGSVLTGSSPMKAGSRSILSEVTAETAPRASPAHVAAVASSIFNNATVSRLGGLNLQQKAVLCSLVASESRQRHRDPYTTPSKSQSRIPTIKGLFEKYTMLCKRDGTLVPLKITEFRDVVASLETLGLVHESTGRMSGLLTPTKTPSRSSKALDDKQVVSAVSEKEVRDSLNGPGADLLLKLFEEHW